MEFMAKLENPKVLKGLADAISFLIDETYLFASPEGMKFNAIDSSHVAMLLAWLPAAFFADYKCTETTKIGINVMDFVKIMRRAKASDEIQLQQAPGNPNMLWVVMKSERSKRTFKLKSKEIQGYDAKEEGLLQSFEETLKDKFTAMLCFEGEVLDEIVKDSAIISDLVKIEIDAASKTVDFSAFDESGDVNIILDTGGKGVLDSTIKANADGIYTLYYLENIIKIASIVDNIKIDLGNNIPMKIEGIISSPVVKNGDKAKKVEPTGAKITYLLAPRVEDQGEEAETAEDEAEAEKNDAADGLEEADEIETKGTGETDG